MLSNILNKIGFSNLEEKLATSRFLFSSRRARMKCYWWNRWLHRRKRNADVIFLLPGLQLAAVKKVISEPLSEDWYREIEKLVDTGFELHKQLPGQEHWRCECSKEL